jgi:hypothetical protein
MTRSGMTTRIVCVRCIGEALRQRPDAGNEGNWALVNVPSGNNEIPAVVEHPEPVHQDENISGTIALVEDPDAIHVCRCHVHTLPRDWGGLFINPKSRVHIQSESA